MPATGTLTYYWYMTSSEGTATAHDFLKVELYDASGQLLTGSLMDYAIPKAEDLSWLEVALAEHPSTVNELGIKGVGESGAIPGAAAIANAVEDAVANLGVTIHEVPVTPARLFALLSKAQGPRR